MSPYFSTKQGYQFRGITSKEKETLFQSLTEIGLLPEQIVEAASYSMAMVVRYALGLSASGGAVCAIAGDSIAGAVALATLRHLVNAGAQGHVFLLAPQENLLLQRQLLPLKKGGVGIEIATPEGLQKALPLSHNALCGMWGASMAPADAIKIVDTLNEFQTPIHTIEAPPGIDVDTGTHQGSPLFASSTLSLGAPLVGLHKAHECAGRHYLCDISINKEMYLRYTEDLSVAFAEQPVTQIMPVLPKENEG